MKVYTKIVYDKDDNIIEENSYNYNGPVSLCEVDDQDEFAQNQKVIANRLKNYNNISRNTKKDRHDFDGIYKEEGNKTDDSKSNVGGLHDNPLHKFATYNTLFTLSGISEKELRNRTYLTNAPHDIIARSGGIGNANVSWGRYIHQTSVGTTEYTSPGIKRSQAYKQNIRAYSESVDILAKGLDIFFENVNILSTTGPNPERGFSNFQKMEFELHEPFNISLVEKIRAATFINGYLDFMDAPLLLTIQWKGFDEHGKQMKDERLERKIPIRIVRVEFDVDAGGAKYQCVAVASEDFAFDDRFKFPRGTVKVQASKWDLWKKALESQLMLIMDREIQENVREKPDIYKFELRKEVLDNAQDMGLVDSASVYTESQAIPSVYAGDNERIEIDGERHPILSAVSANMDSKAALTKLFEDAIRTGFGYSKLTDGFWYEYGKVLMNKSKSSTNTFTENPSKENADALKKYYKSRQFALDLAEEENQYIDWFTIKPKFEVNSGDWDKITKMETKTITFVAVPTKIHVLKFIKPGVSFGKIDWSNKVRKKYDYLYTGENIDIQNLKIFYKTAWFMRNARLYNTTPKEVGKYHTFISEFNQQLKSVFGNEDYTEPLTPTRSYPAFNYGTSLVQKAGDAKSEKKSQEFYDYLTNPQADMMRIELEILGDPAYICQDLFTNLDKNNTKDSDMRGPWNDKYGSFNAEAYQPLIMVNYRLPSDFDGKKGVFDFTNSNRSMFFNGIYQVVKVESSIAQGSFTQTLHCVRLNNQQGTGLDASSVFSKKTKDYLGLTNDDNDNDISNITSRWRTSLNNKAKKSGFLNAEGEWTGKQ